MMKIETPSWLAEVSVDAGANLCRLRHRASMLELLRSPASEEELLSHPETYGVPVLFPPNRIDGGKFTWQGRKYALPLNEPERSNHLHGLVLGRPWTLAKLASDFIVMTYVFPGSDGFPHAFTLSLSYRFASDAVVQEFRVDNNSASPMPFGLGFHTAFSLPPDAWATVTAGDGCWEIVRPRCLCSGKLLAWKSEEDRIFKDSRAVSCHCPSSERTIEGKPFRGALIEYPSSGIRLHYEVDSHYRHWCLWNDGGGHGFLCIEPMTWMIDAPNLDLPPEITGMQALEPGQSWQAKTVLRLESI